MTELKTPIIGPSNVGPKENPNDKPLHLDLGCSGNWNVPTAISENGFGFHCGGNVYYHTDSKNFYGIGPKFYWNKFQGGPLTLPTDRFSANLTLSRGSQSPLLHDDSGKETVTQMSVSNLLVGLGHANQSPTLELGTDSTLFGAVLRTSGRFPGIGLRAYFGTTTSIPFDSEIAGQIPMLAIKGGLELHLAYLDVTTTPASQGLTNWDLGYLGTSQAHRFFRTMGTAQAFSNNAAIVQEYFSELSGEGGTTASIEGLGPLTLLSLFAASGEDNAELTLFTRAQKEQAILIGTLKAAQTLGYILASSGDASITTQTQLFANLHQLGSFVIAGGIGLEGKDILLARLGFEAATFILGSFTADSKAGQALLQGSGQALLATTLMPDQKSFHHFTYEWNSATGNMFGYTRQTYLPAFNLYTGATLLTDGSNAKVNGALGLATQAGPFNLGIGAHMVLLFEGGTKATGGIGIEENVSLVAENRLELGLRLSQDLVGGEFQFAVSPSVGVKF
ncbi:MAG: hypothetical protein A3F82_02575 [Deltaproteobacteria bacterium RIFCSPLOWO2_12_FULL_44_12]|nr:MAG: hypothetical protein A2712_10720 [Deltaproteobacteria bacterium RIFCSPHIGHO2_01_FULL_43_49]OGQ16527.1 MAG: hypothetical protein A3D22_06420 [Deltaproteobacteria bacterium RIFCSPHIGHO2_02_FULL_44_53]OGQ28344.1 MAG: hypothetical protein A3D98_06125 [Deltaproteobacteria bacterium RIFCSPHIGHO2_12_FULL_44_21]OGQ32415.1 MAG: hypothetical protein A2979_10685 [Deltaproteobacteria bacterium RIFCSPLOWO2_01_FULL_45_74]OGQ41540.1 MAG: hypothetical protein A3I70_05030 [Deltaproteobacteria bacterium 